jgi:aryl-alcohol dehydrogenase-like predicted oxidoreductase
MTPQPQKLPVRPLGSQGLEVSAQGLGCMGFSFAYHATNSVGDEDALAVIRRAAELGQSFLDTSDVYGPHTNEELLSRVLADSRDKFTVATKFANTIDMKSGTMSVRGDPEYVKEACAGSLQRLGIDTIDLYYQHRVDAHTPIEETVKAMAELVKEGKVRYLGLSEVSAEDLRKAHAVHPITAVQLEWSLWTRDAEKDVIPTCRDLGIGIVAYSPLGRGFLTGQIKSRDDLAENDGRRRMPRFSEENFPKNLEIVEKVKAVAARHDCTPGQIALAWLHAQGPDVVPIPGTRRIKYLEENVAAFQVKLTQEDLDTLDEVSKFTVGGRYHPMVARFSYDSYHKMREEEPQHLPSNAVSAKA